METQTKHCPRCSQDKPMTEFGRNRSRPDGLQSWCKKCTRAYMADYRDKANYRASVREYDRSPKGRAAHRRYNHSAAGRASKQRAAKRYYQSAKGKACDQRRIARHPERVKARSAVSSAIVAGTLPKAESILCTDCGQPASEYHHDSYAQEHWLDVVPLCKACHVKRHYDENGDPVK